MVISNDSYAWPSRIETERGVTEKSEPSTAEPEIDKSIVASSVRSSEACRLTVIV